KKALPLHPSCSGTEIDSFGFLGHTDRCHSSPADIQAVRCLHYLHRHRPKIGGVRGVYFNTWARHVHSICRSRVRKEHRQLSRYSLIG
ncbi:unnamed protein product, partial [Mycena citricolor]